jgi:hypothetical protein
VVTDPPGASPAAAEGYGEAYSLAVGVDLLPGQTNLRISELVARNNGCLINRGTTPDWVEIQNCSEEGTPPVSLAGISLGENFPSTDDWLSLPPDWSLGPGECLVIFCDSDVDENNLAGGELHAPFDLDGKGDLLVLVGTGPGGAHALIDCVAYGEQKQDTAWARFCPDGGWSEATPTPGASQLIGQVGRGDTDASRTLSLTDAIRLLDSLFQGRPVRCPGAADVNADGRRNVSDAVSLLLSLFAGRPLDSSPVECCPGET